VTRSAYALDTPRGVDWRTRGACGDNPDLWSSTVPAALGMAVHICVRHCPVRFVCAREGQATPPHLRRGVVYGGRVYNQHGAPIGHPNLIPEVHRCGRCS
jgi:hypothetical protein